MTLPEPGINSDIIRAINAVADRHHPSLNVGKRDMLELLRKLARDCVGSSISTEMSLVTSVTVGALVMGMSNFSASVKHRFEVTNDTPALSMSKLEKEKQREETLRRLEFDAREQQLEKERADRRSKLDALSDR